MLRFLQEAIWKSSGRSSLTDLSFVIRLLCADIIDLWEHHLTLRLFFGSMEQLLDLRRVRLLISFSWEVTLQYLLDMQDYMSA